MDHIVRKIPGAQIDDTPLLHVTSLNRPSNLPPRKSTEYEDDDGEQIDDQLMEEILLECM